MWRKPFTKHRWFRKKTRGKSTKLHSWEVYCRTPASDPRSCSQQACTVAVDQSCQRLASKDAWVFKTSLCRKTKTARSPCSLQRCRPCSCPSAILKSRCRCCNQSPAAAIRSLSAADTTRQWLAGCASESTHEQSCGPRDRGESISARSPHRRQLLCRRRSAKRSLRP